MRTNDAVHHRARGFDSLASDSRGGILVIGLIAAPLIALGIYHMSEIGKALVWRENIQNAADAAAFSSAILHAQGMNALVALNIIMALAMAVLIAWRVFEIFVMFLTVAVGIACAVPFTAPVACPAVGHLGRFSANLAKRDPTVSNRVMKVCAGVNVLEKLVATAAPPIAMGYSIINTWTDYNANFVLTLSPSLAMPPLEDLRGGGLKKAFAKDTLKKKFTECFEGHKKPVPGPHRRGPRSGGPAPDGHGGGHGHSNMDKWEEVSQRRMGFLFSLPAQEDHLGKLCMKAGKLLDPIVLKFVQGTIVEQLFHFAAGVKDELLGSVPSLFCSPSDTLHKQLADDLDTKIDKEAKAGCQQTKKHFMDLTIPERKQHRYYTNRAPRGQGRNAGWGSFDHRKCEKESKEEAKKHWGDRTAQRKAQDQVLECVKPARVWEPSRNGNVFMHSFSWVNKDLYRPPPGPPTVRPADERPPEYVPPPSDKPVIRAAPEPTTVRAQAEMYFDCKGGWRDKCDPDAMWKFKWKAHLVPVGSLRDLANEAIASAVAAGIAIGGQELFMEKVYHSKLGEKLGIGNYLQFDTKYGTATNHVAYRVQEALRDLLLQNVDTAPILH
jgi:hypothetical protein